MQSLLERLHRINPARAGGVQGVDDRARGRR